MATFDQLSADQKAIVELLLKQDKTYDELSEMLGLPVARVKELARSALVSMSPNSARAVDEDWRGQVADYLLNQQSGPEATATRGHLRRSEAARAWSRSLLDSLDQFYDRTNLPTIPDGEPHAEPAPRARRRPPADEDESEDRPARPKRALSPAAAEIVRRRRLVGAGLAGVLVLLIVLVWPVGLLTGDDDKKNASADSETQVKLEGQLLLKPVSGSSNTAAGLAVIAARGDDQQLIVQARLPASKNREAYEVWLYNSPSDAKSLGAQVTDKDGNFQGAGPLPGDYKKYKYIEISREKVDTNRAHSGTSILRGAVADFQPVPESAQQGATSTAPAPQATTPQTTTTP
jgi:hypothetical protein